MKAKILADAISVFNPREPLIGDELVEFYVDRPGNPLERMKIYLQGIGLNDEPVKLLFSGHRGSGKSTELNKLAEALKRQFFIVPVNLSKFVNVTTLTYQDVLLGMALALFRRASESEAVAQSPAAAIRNAWGEAIGFVQEKIYGPAMLRPLSSADELKVKVSAGIAELELKYGLAPTAREQLAIYLDAHLDELHNQMDIVAGLVRKEIKRPALFIVEGTDKTDISRAREIFRDHTNALTAFRAAAIYTFPIGLAYSGEFNQFKTSFDHHFALPNLKLAHRDGTPDADGPAHLREVVSRRLADELIEPAALDLLAQASGGVVLLLVRVAQSAAVHALSRGSQTITADDAHAAIAEERSDFIRQLKPEDYPVLAARHADKELSSQREVQDLLQGLALLEYANNEPWCDVHPVIWPVVEDRTR